MQCKCLDIINERLEEIKKKTTPFDAIDEKDFYELQALLKIYIKIEKQNQS